MYEGEPAPSWQTHDDEGNVSASAKFPAHASFFYQCLAHAIALDQICLTVNAAGSLHSDGSPAGTAEASTAFDPIKGFEITALSPQGVLPRHG
jgi:hypothetical protein